MKRLDDLETKRERDAEFTGEKYTSRFKNLTLFKKTLWLHCRTRY
jgi:hypothetical protein